MDTINPQRGQGAEGLEIAGNDPQAYTTAAPKTPLSIASFDFDPLEDISSKLEVISELVDTAIDEMPATEQRDHRSELLLFAAFWMLAQQRDALHRLTTNLIRLKREAVSHA